MADTVQELAPNRSYRAPTVGKAFQILELVARSKPGMTISDLSRQLRISKSTVHGIIAALEEAGAVVRDVQNKRYSLGLTLFDLGRAAYSRIDMKDVARPFLEDLMVKTRESCFFGMRNGDHVSILDIVESTQDIKITAPVGTGIPLLAGATGKVFLASMPDDQAIELLQATGLHRFTANTITDPARYLDQLKAVRKDGYALDDEEYIPGVRAVAAPVRGQGQLAAIWVVGFTPRLNAEKMKPVALRTKLTAEALGQEIQARASRGAKVCP